MEWGSQLAASWPRPPATRYEILDLNLKIGNFIPLADIRIGTWVHDIEFQVKAQSWLEPQELLLK